MVVYTCHCADCQRLSGSAFSLVVFVTARGFRLVRGEPRLLQSVADSGRLKTRLVCPDCGCWVCNIMDPDDGMRRVRAGTLDDTSWLRPTMHFWTRNKQPWISLPDGDRVFATQPDQ